MQSDQVLNATAAWLNGDIEHAWMGEGLSIEKAQISNGFLLITYRPTEPGQVPFQAAFVLSSIELQTSAIIRQDEAK